MLSFRLETPSVQLYGLGRLDARATAAGRRRYLDVSYLAGEVHYLGHLGCGDDSGDHAGETD